MACIAGSAGSAAPCAAGGGRRQGAAHGLERRAARARSPAAAAGRGLLPAQLRLRSRRSGRSPRRHRSWRAGDGGGGARHDGRRAVPSREEPGLRAGVSRTLPRSGGPEPRRSSPRSTSRAGQVVRLAEGDMARATVYGDDPAGTGRRRSRTPGADHLHVVDLDGAFAGHAVNAGDAVERRSSRHSRGKRPARRRHPRPRRDRTLAGARRRRAW